MEFQCGLSAQTNVQGLPDHYPDYSPRELQRAGVLVTVLSSPFTVLSFIARDAGIAPETTVTFQDTGGAETERKMVLQKILEISFKSLS